MLPHTHPSSHDILRRAIEDMVPVENISDVGLD
jgi:hypothetical protein